MWEDVRRCEKMWEDVRRCEKMWEDVRRCEKMWEDVKMRRCEKMWRWEDVRRCEKMWRWEDEEKMRRCEDEKMRRRCEDQEMWRWEDVKMRRWGEDVRMRRCEDEKMWRWEGVLQTPTIRRTLRSDALGKKTANQSFPSLEGWCGLETSMNHQTWSLCQSLGSWPASQELQTEHDAQLRWVWEPKDRQRNRWRGWVHLSQSHHTSMAPQVQIGCQRFWQFHQRTKPKSSLRYEVHLNPCRLQEKLVHCQVCWLMMEAGHKPSQWAVNSWTPDSHQLHRGWNLVHQSTYPSLLPTEVATTQLRVWGKIFLPVWQFSDLVQNLSRRFELELLRRLQAYCSEPTWRKWPWCCASCKTAKSRSGEVKHPTLTRSEQRQTSIIGIVCRLSTSISTSSWTNSGALRSEKDAASAGAELTSGGNSMPTSARSATSGPKDGE